MPVASVSAVASLPGPGVASVLASPIAEEVVFPTRAKLPPQSFDRTVDEDEEARQAIAPLAADGLVDQIVADQQHGAEIWLECVSPAAATEFRASQKRLAEAADVAGCEQPALLAQGLESLRRGLNRLADDLFPPQSSKVSDRFGEPRRADQGGYVSRLTLALGDAADSKDRSRLERVELELFSRGLNVLVSRLAAGVHGEGDFDESQRLYVHAWLVVGACRTYLS